MTTGRARLSQDNIPWFEMSTDTIPTAHDRSCGDWLVTKKPIHGRSRGASSDPAAQNRPASDGQPRHHWHQRPRPDIHRGMC